MKTKITIAALVFISICAAVLFWRLNSVINFKCPNDYATAEEYADGTAQWLRLQLDANPKISQEELLAKREKALESNNCNPSKWFIEANEQIDSTPE